MNLTEVLSGWLLVFSVVEEGLRETMANVRMIARYEPIPKIPELGEYAYSAWMQLQKQRYRYNLRVI